MAAKNVYMKRLDVVEALGATTLIESDKTGTLTKNDMTVTELWCNRAIIKGFPETKKKNGSGKGKNDKVSTCFELGTWGEGRGKFGRTKSSSWATVSF